MGLAGLVGSGGPGERGEHDDIATQAYTLHGCKGRTQHGNSLKASGGWTRRFFVPFSMGSGWVETEKRGKRRVGG
jgi:hypothetical protein